MENIDWQLVIIICLTASALFTAIVSHGVGRKTYRFRFRMLYENNEIQVLAWKYSFGNDIITFYDTKGDVIYQRAGILAYIYREDIV